MRFSRGSKREKERDIKTSKMIWLTYSEHLLQIEGENDNEKDETRN